MVIKVYVSMISCSQEVKKNQQRAVMILESKNIPFTTIDITDPGQEDSKDYMNENAKPKGENKVPMTPQIFNEAEYCGDFDDLDMSNENDTLGEFLKLTEEEKKGIKIGITGILPEERARAQQQEQQQQEQQMTNGMSAGREGEAQVAADPLVNDADATTGPAQDGGTGAVVDGPEAEAGFEWGAEDAGEVTRDATDGDAGMVRPEEQDPNAGPPVSGDEPKKEAVEGDATQVQREDEAEA